MAVPHELVTQNSCCSRRIGLNTADGGVKTRVAVFWTDSRHALDVVQLSRGRVIRKAAVGRQPRLQMRDFSIHCLCVSCFRGEPQLTVF